MAQWEVKRTSVSGETVLPINDKHVSCCPTSDFCIKCGQTLKQMHDKLLFKEEPLGVCRGYRVVGQHIFLYLPTLLDNSGYDEVPL